MRRAPSARDGDEALARLVYEETKVDASLAELVGDCEGERVLTIRDRAHASGVVHDLGERDRDASVVRIARDVFARVPTERARVELLRLARRASKNAVVVCVAVASEHTHLGRALVDGPRRALRAVGLPLPEPGDRFGPARYVHAFFDEEALIVELAQAGLVIAKRRGFTFMVRPLLPENTRVPERAEAFVVEVGHVMRTVRDVDLARSTDTAHGAVTKMRARGAAAHARGPVGRARLRRAIGWIDALAPGGANCYRRVLLEIALDAGAAGERLVFGLDVGRTGHVAFEDREERSFDVSFTIGPREEGAGPIAKG